MRRRRKRGATAGPAVAAVEPKPKRRCRVCGCTDDRACPGGCSWVALDLCSRCEGSALGLPLWHAGGPELVEFRQSDQEAFVRQYLGAPHVTGETDPLRREFNVLVAKCQLCGETELAVSVITLLGLRGAGFHADAAGQLLQLVVDRRVLGVMP